MLKRLDRKLADGIPSRLEYDFSCNRGHSFGEYYLHGTINEIVSANIDPGEQVPHSGFPHPAIVSEFTNNTETKQGRKPEVDFYIEHRLKDGPSTCIEAKWAGSSHCTPNRILYDLCRLTWIKQYSPDTTCLLVVAGGNTKLKKLFNRKPLAPASEGARRILERPHVNKTPKIRSYPLLEADGTPVDAISKYAENTALTIPRRIRSTLVTPSIHEPPRWQALIWRIS